MSQIHLAEYSGVHDALTASMPFARRLSICREVKKDALIRGKNRMAGYASRSVGEALRRLGMTEQAHIEFSAARDILRSIDDPDGVAWVNWAMSNLARQTANYGSATRLAQRNLEFVEGQDLDSWYLRTYSLAGYAETLRVCGQYRLAGQLHQMLLQRFRKLDDYRGVVWSYEGLAQMYKNIGEYDRSSQLFRKALRISSEIGDHRGLAYALRGIGALNTVAGRTTDSLGILQRARETFRRLGLMVGKAYTSKAIGDALLQQHDIEGAWISYRAALEDFNRLGDIRGSAYTRVGIGNLWATIGATQRAKETYRKESLVFETKNIKYGQYLVRRSLWHEREADVGRTVIVYGR